MTFAERLAEYRSGRHRVLDELVPVVYEELRAIAHRQLIKRGRNTTFSTTAVVNEAYLKLVGHGQSEWDDRRHFLAIAALAMRQVIIDHAKALKREKRGGDQIRITLDQETIALGDQPDAVLQINDALERLAVAAPRLARIVEYRFFGGLSEDEIAHVLDVNVRTVQRDWAKARMLLRRELESPE